MNGLVVDPSPIQRRILANVLRQAGCEAVEAAEDLAQGLATLADGAATPFDLVIVERDLPDGNGLDVVRRFRESPAEGPATALLVTARNGRRDVMDAIEAGVDAYVLKPLDPPALLERIEAARAVERPADPVEASGEGDDGAAAESPAAAEPDPAAEVAEDETRQAA